MGQLCICVYRNEQIWTEMLIFAVCLAAGCVVQISDQEMSCFTFSRLLKEEDSDLHPFNRLETAGKNRGFTSLLFVDVSNRTVLSGELQIITLLCL